ncbi:Tyrosine--tRNA ligase, mitochondrial [Orchesella cincta]|uniref:Tyrosine--tRNA ligase n=1 Tax=Orchesella cincta TaxID=48709 RepID=A0A1D2MRP7_ORCCI|nr:Tyrosine--tRNA ligase, mitochondrial [Orchesella cincta]
MSMLATMRLPPAMLSLKKTVSMVSQISSSSKIPLLVSLNQCSCATPTYSTWISWRRKRNDDMSGGGVQLSRKQLVVLNLRRHYTNRNLLTLRERGLVSQIFPDKEIDLRNLCVGKPQTVYAGFDPTADSLHVGNLAVLMLLLHCQRAGHSPIALIGGATGLIGDPSGKNSERPALDRDVAMRNAGMLAKNIATVFENHNKLFWDSKLGKERLPECIIVNNADWYSNMSSLEFFSKLGRHFRVGQMMMRHSVQSRLNSEEGISFTEFSYQVFQAYDWYHLYKNYGCRIQLGGHDQMGNIVSGHDFISRAFKKQVYGITVPLITSETGNKYGKTAGNAVWLDPDKTSPFEMLQFFVRTPDDDVERLLKIFTFRTDDEINALMSKHKLNPELRTPQLELASDITRLVHGDAGFEKAMKATDALYAEDVDALASISAKEIDQLFKGTQAAFSEIYLEPGTTVLTMALKAKCFDSEKDAKRIIQAGGFIKLQPKIRISRNGSAR